MRTDTERLMIIYLIWSVGLAFGSALLFPYFASLGFSTLELLFLGLLNYLAPLFFLFIWRKYQSNTALVVGSIAVGLSYAVLFIGHGMIGPSLMYIIGAASFFLFWIPFNTMWFELDTKKNAGHSTIYNGVSLLIGVLGPAAAGVIAQQYGYAAVFILTIPIFVICAAIAWFYSPHKKADLKIRESVQTINGFKTLFFLEGVLKIGAVVLIPIISIKYFPDPVQFGLFLSGVTVFSVLASFVFSKISDTSGSRREFTIASSIGIGLSLVFTSVAPNSNAAWWFAGSSLLAFFSAIFTPFPLAILMDTKRSITNSMYGREIWLNIGRSAGAILSIALFLITNDLRIPLAVIGVLMIVYAIVFQLTKYNKILGKTNQTGFA